MRKNITYNSYVQWCRKGFREYIFIRFRNEIHIVSPRQTSINQFGFIHYKWWKSPDNSLHLPYPHPIEYSTTTFTIKIIKNLLRCVKLIPKVLPPTMCYKRGKIKLRLLFLAICIFCSLFFRFMSSITFPFIRVILNAIDAVRWWR